MDFRWVQSLALPGTMSPAPRAGDSLRYLDQYTASTNTLAVLPRLAVLPVLS